MATIDKKEVVGDEVKPEINPSEASVPEIKSDSADTASEPRAQATKPVMTGENEEKKVKKAFLEKFKLVKHSDKANGDEAKSTSAEETHSAEVMSETLYKQLNEVNKNQYFIFRIKKRAFILGFGILITLMWVVVGVMSLIEWKAPHMAFWNRPTQEQVTLQETPSPTLIPPDIRIRVRNHLNATVSAQAIVTLLADNGYPGAELIDDPESDYQGLVVVTKPEDAELRQELEKILSELYVVSSPSAELTQDSDFSAVILFGKNAITAEEVTPTPILTRSSSPTREASISGTLGL